MASILYLLTARQARRRTTLNDDVGNLWLGTGSDEAAAIAAAADAAHAAGQIPSVASPAVLLPSHRDLVLGSQGQAVLARLVEYGLAARPVEPPSVLGLRGASWTRLKLRRPDVRLTDVTLLSSVVQAGTRIAVIAIRPDAVGPTALNVLTRYAHPRLRVLILASRECDALAAEVNLACRLDLLVVVGPLANVHVAAVTRDRIAGELVGLALRDEPHLASREVVGPWEDALVQRATELDLGVAVPSQLRFHQPARFPPRASDALDRLRLRLGMAPHTP